MVKAVRQGQAPNLSKKLKMKRFVFGRLYILVKYAFLHKFQGERFKGSKFSMAAPQICIIVFRSADHFSLFRNK